MIVLTKVGPVLGTCLSSIVFRGLRARHQTQARSESEPHLQLWGIALALATLANAAPAPFEISGIYPHLAKFNSHSECTDPANKIYYASMEEGFYEVDVRTLAVTELFRDEQVKEPFRRADLPGYHGKGLYSGQGRPVYANNGEHGKDALAKPDIPSGALAEWDGKSDTWTLIRRNQFTEVTGPGGIFGNEKPDTDPIWTIGWDHRSLILMVREAASGSAGGSPASESGPAARAPNWHSYRLPKASHSYDGAHGWNTEWPRIREIGENDLLMTMHGSFWRFPRSFGVANSAGVAPRSNYLKVIGDFARWGDRLVMGCDDTAQSEFLNKRRAKGKLAGPGQSQSNPVFDDGV